MCKRNAENKSKLKINYTGESKKLKKKKRYYKYFKTCQI